MKRLLRTAALIVLGIKALEFCKRKTFTLLREKTIDEKRIYGLVETSKDIIYYFSVTDYQFKYLSPSIDRIFGKGHREDCFADAQLAFENVHPGDLSVIHKKLSGDMDYKKPILQRWKDQKGNYLWFEEYATPIYENGEVIAIQGIIRNVDEKIKLQQSLKRQLNLDSLTGVHNRYFFDNKMRHLNEMDVSLGLILCDLDNLKVTNDKYGHKVGDQLIRETASLLSQIQTNNMAVARIGGDEFAVLLVGVNYAKVQRIAEEIGNRIDRYNKELSCSNEVKLSFGIAFRHSSTGQTEKLFHEADQQMYQYKNEKREDCDRVLALSSS